MGDITVEDIEGLGNQPEYSPFHPEIDEKYPIDKITSQENLQDISDGKVGRLHWVRAFNNSPAKNAEAEAIMGQVVTHSVRAGQWVDIPVVANEDIEPIELPDGTTVEFPGAKWDFEKGSEILKERGLANLVQDDDGKSMISPVEKMAELVASRLK